MYIKEIIDTLEAIAPVHLQESYDNAGLIVGNPQTELTGVLFCLDSTEIIVLEAIQKGCNLIVAHHPIVFRGLKRFNEANYVERTIMLAIRHHIAIYAIHTNLDNVYHQGVNAKIAERLGLHDTRILMPKAGSTDIGAGLIGMLPHPISEIEFLQQVKITLNAACIKHTELSGKMVQHIAVCGGSGSFLLDQALKAKADFFVSSDFKYHEFFDAENQIVIADIGHYETEQYTIVLLHDIIAAAHQAAVPLYMTECNTNPVRYF